MSPATILQKMQSAAGSPMVAKLPPDPCNDAATVGVWTGSGRQPYAGRKPRGRRIAATVLRVDRPRALVDADEHRRRGVRFAGGGRGSRAGGADQRFRAVAPDPPRTGTCLPAPE